MVKRSRASVLSSFFVEVTASSFPLVTILRLRNEGALGKTRWKRRGTPPGGKGESGEIREKERPAGESGKVARNAVTLQFDSFRRRLNG